MGRQDLNKPANPLGGEKVEGEAKEGLAKRKGNSIVLKRGDVRMNLGMFIEKLKSATGKKTISAIETEVIRNYELPAKVSKIKE